MGFGTHLPLLSAGIRLEFVRPIKDVTVKERETAEFSVELSHDNISVVWYKNDVRLHPSKVVHMSDQGKIHTLAFKEVSIDDTSMIKVEAMDKTVTAMLTVMGQHHTPATRTFEGALFRFLLWPSARAFHAILERKCS